MCVIKKRGKLSSTLIEKEQRQQREAVKINRILIITRTIIVWRETILYEMNDLELQ